MQAHCHLAHRHHDKKGTALEPRQISELLDRYTSAASLIHTNLDELDNQPTYVQLTAGTLGPETDARLGPSMRRAPELWHWLKLLQDVLAEARGLVGEGRLNTERRQRLVYLLTGPSILIGMGQTPLESRDLLGASQHELRLSIESLLGRMRGVYEPIRDGVAEVERIWRELLPRIDAAGATMTRLSGQLSELGVADPLVAETGSRLDELRSRMALDPLAVSVDDGEVFDSMLDRAVARVAEIRRGHDELDDDMESIESNLLELRSARARAAAARSETEAKILAPGRLIQVPAATAIDGPGGLADRADDLHTTAVMGPWTERRKRIDDWMAIAGRMREQLERADEINRAPLAKRADLRGLLSAYKAKAVAMGRGEDIGFTSLADSVHNELHTAPTDLERAEKLVADLGSYLRASRQGVPK